MRNHMKNKRMPTNKSEYKRKEKWNEGKNEKNIFFLYGCDSSNDTITTIQASLRFVERGMEEVQEI